MSAAKGGIFCVALLIASFVCLSIATPSVGIYYKNWDGVKTCTPTGYYTPSNEHEIQQIIHYSKDVGASVKVVGGGLSFSGVQMSEGGHLISLDKMNKILNVTYNEEGGALVEVQSGIRLRELCRELDALGLAMVNLGATATQSVVGAAATGTHGTGTELGAIATQIVSLRIIDAAGVVHVASATENTELFDAARVGVGALGIISSVTLSTEKLWKMKKYSLSYSLQQLFHDLPSLLKQYSRLQWSWVPYTDAATVLIREDVPWESELVPSGPDGGCWSLSQSTSECTDVSYKTLTDSLPHYLNRSLYTEMEMFIPIEHTQAAVQDFIDYMDSVRDQHNPNVTISGMVRYVAGDDIYLSPMQGRDTAVISFIALGDLEVTGDQTEFELYARGLEEICATKYAGRPHWGKVSYADIQDTAAIRQAYGDKAFDAFALVRTAMDPTGMFLNEYLQQRLV